MSAIGTKRTSRSNLHDSHVSFDGDLIPYVFTHLLYGVQLW